MRFNIQILLTSLLLCGVAQAVPRPEVDAEYQYRIFTEALYDSTSANYDKDGGGYEALPDGNSFKVMEGRLGGEFWFNEDFTVYGQAGFGRAESYNNLNNANTTRSNSGPTEVTAGLRYVLGRTPAPILVDLSGTFPIYRVDPLADDVLLNEGALKIDMALWSELWFGPIKSYGRVGFLYQDDGRSSPAQALVGASWEPEMFSLGGEVYYSKTLINDEFTDDRPKRETVLTRVDAGSYRFYSVNPDLLGARAVANIELGQSMRLGLVFDKTLNGKSAAAGWSALARFEMHFGTTPTNVGDETEKRPKVLDKAPEENDTFQPEPTNYDDTLFREAKPKVLKRPKKKRTKGKKPMDVDKALEDVQKSLEN